MADLIMTIDSDSSDVEQTPKQLKRKEKATKKENEEEILLAHSVILQDTEHDSKRT